MAFDSDAQDQPADIIVAPEPFTSRVERLEARQGATIAEILTEACRLEVLDPQDLARAEVFLDGVRIEDRVEGLNIRPAPGQMLNVAVLPAGGGGSGGNKVLSTVLEIALIAAVAWVAGPAAAGVATTFNTSVAVVRVGATVAQLVGSFAVSEIAQPLTGSAPDSFEDL